MIEDRAEGELVKYSILIPPYLDRLIVQACADVNRKKSELIREMIEKQVGRYLKIPTPAGPASGDREVITIELHRELIDGLAAAGRALNVETSSMIQIILTEQLTTYLERGMKQQDALRALMTRTSEATASRETARGKK
jgi:hypothetical protein